jgi:hypothetical protein
MAVHRHRKVILVVAGALLCGTASAKDRPVSGLIPKAQKPIPMDGKLTGGTERS